MEQMKQKACALNFTEEFGIPSETATFVPKIETRACPHCRTMTPLPLRWTHRSHEDDMNARALSLSEKAALLPQSVKSSHPSSLFCKTSNFLSKICTKFCLRKMRKNFRVRVSFFQFFFFQRPDTSSYYFWNCVLRKNYPENWRRSCAFLPKQFPV